MCVYTFSYFGSCMLDHIAWGFLFLLFLLPDVTHTHTHTVLARMILIRAPKRPVNPTPGSGQYISKLFFPINFIFLALFISPFFFFGWKHRSSSPTVFLIFFPFLLADKIETRAHPTHSLFVSGGIYHHAQLGSFHSLLFYRLP